MNATELGREAALERLKATSWQSRLSAARSLLVTARSGDLPAILTARATETAMFVKDTLDAVVRRINRDAEEGRASNVEELPSLLLKQVNAKAVEEVTRTLLHELEPIVGQIELAAATEIESFDSSRTRQQLDLLGQQLAAIGQLKMAARVPLVEEFALDVWLNELVDTIGHPRNDFWLVGPKDLIVEGDPALLRLAVSNGLKNAIEAVEAIRPRTEDEHDAPRIVVSWDRSDSECWISIKDEGAGLLGPATEVVKVGRTTKRGHAGMGLAIAKQAMETLAGTLELEPGAEAGTRFEVRWFIQ